MFSFKLEKLNFDEELGSGQFGTVYAYQKSPDDREWVVKRILASKVEDLLACMDEIVLGFSCDHPHVLPIRGYYIEPDKAKRTWTVYMKLPRMESSLGSEIRQFAKSKTPIPEKEIIKYFYALTHGLKYLHDKKIAHRDIKPDNILIDTHGEIKISDIGIGKFIGDEGFYMMSDPKGSILYSAPEIVKRDPNLKKNDLLRADLWSLGVVMAELCTLVPRIVDVAATGHHNETKIANLLKGVEGRYSNVLLDLITSLVQHIPTERKSLLEVQRSLEANFSDVLELPRYDKEIQVTTPIEKSSMIGGEENEEMRRNSSFLNFEIERLERQRKLDQKQRILEAIVEKTTKKINVGYDSVDDEHSNIKILINHRKKEEARRHLKMVKIFQRELSDLVNIHQGLEKASMRLKVASDLSKAIDVLEDGFQLHVEYTTENNRHIRDLLSEEDSVKEIKQDPEQAAAFLNKICLAKQILGQVAENMSVVCTEDFLEKICPLLDFRKITMILMIEEKKTIDLEMVSDLMKIVNAMELKKEYAKEVAKDEEFSKELGELLNDIAADDVEREEDMDDMYKELEEELLNISMEETKLMEELPKKYSPLFLFPQENDLLASLTEKEVPEGLTLEQVKDPSNPDFIDCLGFLHILAENHIKVSSTNSTNAAIKATALENKFGSGEVEPFEYVETLKLAIDKEKKLIEFYKSKSDNDRLAFTLERTKKTAEELKELEEALAAQE